MEMEEGRDQPNIAPAPKRMKFQEIMDKGEEDRISVLPDCLLLEILSRLPSTKEAIRTGTLSKRWEHLWTWVPALIFHDDELKFTWADFVSFVDKTLTQCRQLKLKKFEVFTPGCVGFESQVNNWIHYAIRCNVEKLCLVLWGKDDDEFPLEQSFSINTCVTDLTLSCCKLDPIGVISWKSLRSLCILYGNLEEDLIKNILSGSPLLETLVLDKCYVYWRLDIISKSVKNLVLNNCHGCGPLDFDFVEIKAPNIKSLKIKGERFLWNFLFVNLSSLVEANLDYTNTTPTKAEEEKLKRFIINLRHVKELKIGVSCSEVLSRLEAVGFVFPSNMKLPNAS